MFIESSSEIKEMEKLSNTVLKTVTVYLGVVVMMDYASVIGGQVIILSSNVEIIPLLHQAP